MANACYVYAIVGRDMCLPAAIAGFGGTAVTMVFHCALGAAISCVEPTAIWLTPQNLWHHETVVEAIHLRGPALPARFGVLLPDHQALARAMGERYEVLVDDLTRLGDKVEMGVSVLWDPGQVETSEAGLGELGLLGLPPVSPGIEYLRGRLAERRRSALLRDYASAVARDLLGPLREAALENRCAVLPTPLLLLRAVFLVHRSQADVFRDVLEVVSHANPNLKFMLSGPWPPYSFVTSACSGARQALFRPSAIALGGQAG